RRLRAAAPVVPVGGDHARPDCTGGVDIVDDAFTNLRAGEDASRKGRMIARHIVMIASEAMPFSKTGGLADVMGAWPAALSRLGWRTTVVIPKYRGVSAGRLAERFRLTVGSFTCEVGVFEAPLDDGATAVLIECPDLYDREAIYGPNNTDYPDNPRRFAFL